MRSGVLSLGVTEGFVDLPCYGPAEECIPGEQARASVANVVDGDSGDCDAVLESFVLK